MALEFTFNRRGRERREFEAALGVEAFDRLQHAEARDLQEVVEGFAAVRESTREVRGQRLVRFDQFVAELPIAALSVLDELRPKDLSLFSGKCHLRWQANGGRTRRPDGPQ